MPVLEDQQTVYNATDALAAQQIAANQASGNTSESAVPATPVDVNQAAAEQTAANRANPEIPPAAEPAAPAVPAAPEAPPGPAIPAGGTPDQPAAPAEPQPTPASAISVPVPERKPEPPPEQTGPKPKGARGRQQQGVSPDADEYPDTHPRIMTPKVRYDELQTSNPALYDNINKVSDQLKIDPVDLTTLAWTDGGLKPGALPFNLNPNQVKEVATANPQAKDLDPSDPSQNLLIGAMRLRMADDTFGPKTPGAFAAFKEGTDKVSRLARLPQDEQDKLAPNLQPYLHSLSNPDPKANPAFYGPPDMTYRYNTKLSPEQEQQYQAWVKYQSTKTGRDMSNDTADYDLRGAFLNNAQQSADGHFPDTYKKPNHPTFSDQSMYNGKDGYVGGTWGGQENAPTFTPGATNLQLHGKQGLQDYMQRVEPNTKLVDPAQVQNVNMPNVGNPSGNKLAAFAVDNARPGQPSSIEGVDNHFADNILAMTRAMPPAIRDKFKIGSGFRDAQRQAQVNPDVTNSHHMYGLGIDVVRDPDVLNWINQYGQNFHVGFPLRADPKEDNHLEQLTDQNQRIPPDQTGNYVRSYALPKPGQPTPGDPRGLMPVITQLAQKYHIDPQKAIQVAGTEGLLGFNSGIQKPDGTQEQSFGAYQLNTEGGMGNEFQRDMKLDPKDPKNEVASIDYALYRASKEGWGAFHGAANTGIGQWDGIDRGQAGTAVPIGYAAGASGGGGGGTGGGTGAPGTQYASAGGSGGAVAPGTVAGGTGRQPINGNGDMTAPGLVRAAAGGPNVFREYLVNEGPAGASMSDLWRHAENTLTSLAVLRGDTTMALHAHDIILQQSMNGVSQDLKRAYAAYKAGDMQNAASYVASAKSYFPDGSTMGVSTDGRNIYGQLYLDHAGHQPMGQPFAINDEYIFNMLNATQNTKDYVDTLHSHQQVIQQAARDAESKRHSIVEEGQGVQRIGLEGQRLTIEGQRLAEEQRSHKVSETHAGDELTRQTAADAQRAKNEQAQRDQAAQELARQQAADAALKARQEAETRKGEADAAEQKRYHDMLQQKADQDRQARLVAAQAAQDEKVNSYEKGVYDQAKTNYPENADDTPENRQANRLKSKIYVAAAGMKQGGPQLDDASAQDLAEGLAGNKYQVQWADGSNPKYPKNSARIMGPKDPGDPNSPPVEVYVLPPSFARNLYGTRVETTNVAPTPAQVPMGRPPAQRGALPPPPGLGPR
jgi:hypothetical protein